MCNISCGVQGELYAIGNSWKIYRVPCGDLCATTCLEQADAQPTYAVRHCRVESVDRHTVLYLLAHDALDTRARSTRVRGQPELDPVCVAFFSRGVVSSAPHVICSSRHTGGFGVRICRVHGE